MEKTSILESKKNRVITDLVLFGVSFGVGFIMNLMITNAIHFMLYLVVIYSLFSMTSLGFGALYNAFEHSYVKRKLKYTYWMFQLMIISCVAQVLAHLYFLEQTTLMGALTAMLIGSIILLMIGSVIAFIGFYYF